MKHLLYFVVMAALMMALSYVLPGFHVDSPLAALIAAVVLGAVNTFVKPVLFVLTLPFTIVTLGLFLLVLNALMLALVDVLVPGLRIDGLATLIVASLALAIAGMIWKSASRKEKE
jgi:putative membrane protein